MCQQREQFIQTIRFLLVERNKHPINIHNTAKDGVATPEVHNLDSREMHNPTNEGK
jgi:hypothetical protein